MISTYQFKTEPYAHQAALLAKHWDAQYRGLLLEQGTGKSKLTIDTAGMLYSAGRINCMVVIAPNGVHTNWVVNEIPTHLPDYIARESGAWTNGKPPKIDYFAKGEHLRILTINIEAMATKAGFEFVQKLLRVTNALLVIDESTRIKNPSAQRTKGVMKLAKLARYRRILNGTPVTQSPMDMFSQLLFLDDTATPTTSFVAFRRRYAEMLDASSPLVAAIMRKSGSRFAPNIIATDHNGKPKYRNLEDLKQWVDKSCDRVTKEECLDLPEKIYKRGIVVMQPSKMRLIKAYLKDIKDGMTDQPVSKLTAVMLYQRMLCGVIPKQLSASGEDEPMYEDIEENPRIQALASEIEDIDGSVIIWCRFIDDIKLVKEYLDTHYPRQSATYYGDTSTEDRTKIIADFQSGKVRFFIGQAQSGGVGITLTKATTVIYYSNDFSLYNRLQSEDRAHRIGQREHVTYIDLEVLGTVDSKIIDSLRSKKDVADLITGDSNMGWLE
jgi:SNF2 family DNA or RNA helicase